jgi:hypothetical protein
MADSGFKYSNLKKVQARVSRLPLAAQKAMKATLKVEVDGLVEAIKTNMPFDAGNEDHEHLRDSVHAYENPKRAVGFIVVADAKDAAGKPIGSNIEAGHRAADGTHVAARPAFFPTWRALRKGIRSRVSRAAKAATKRAWESVNG